jgi:DNA repair protein RadC
MKEKTTVAEISISYKPCIADKPIIKSPLDAYFVLRDFFPADTIHLQESFVVMYLNKSNRVLGVFPGFKGGITSTVVDVRLILSVALKTAATNIVLAHNHPSGNLQPSKPDIELTLKIKEAAKYLDIKVSDHIIVSSEPNQYLSFADEGLI